MSLARRTGLCLVQTAFAGTVRDSEDHSFGMPAISRFKVEEERASLRLTVDLTVINLKSLQSVETAAGAQLRIGQGGWEMGRYGGPRRRRWTLRRRWRSQRNRRQTGGIARGRERVGVC